MHTANRLQPHRMTASSMRRELLELLLERLGPMRNSLTPWRIVRTTVATSSALSTSSSVPNSRPNSKGLFITQGSVLCGTRQHWTGGSA